LVANSKSQLLINKPIKALSYFSEKMSVIAIDLGTANTRIAIWENGAVKILKNVGNRVTPSYVAFTAHERFIGDAAKNQVLNEL
jgi:molecular chaperone DnaK (HSP70)